MITLEEILEWLKETEGLLGDVPLDGDVLDVAVAAMAHLAPLTWKEPKG